MLHKKFLYRLCPWILLLAVLHFLAMYFHWYNLIWWFDMPMHFLGGFTAFYFSAILWLPARKWVSDKRFIFEALITTVLIGVLWEALELYLYLSYGSPLFLTADSISDVVFDFSGALLAAYYAVPHLTQDRLANKSAGVVS